MSTFSPVSPDTYEKPSPVREAPVTQISSNSASSTASLPAQQDVIAATSEKPSAITPMPVWMDTSLAVMTLGLSVPAFHIVKYGPSLQSRSTFANRCLGVYPIERLRKHKRSNKPTGRVQLVHTWCHLQSYVAQP